MSSINDFGDGNTTLLANLQSEINKINDKLNQVILNNRSLKSDIVELTAENNDMYNLIYDMESQMNNLNQYMRQSNIEIRNIPEHIGQRNLEQYVLKVLESIGVKLVSYDVVAVHRLGKYIDDKHRNVIIRFVNQKNAYSPLRNAKKIATSNILEYKNLYIIENLCPTYKKIFNYRYKLKKDNKISIVWSYNGSVFFKKINSDEEYGQKVEHFDDIQYFLYDKI